MKFRNFTIICLIASLNFCLASTTFAQVETLDSANTVAQPGEIKKGINYNFIKTNITSILLKNYSLQFERTLSRKISVALQYRIMPTTGIPFKSSILKLVEDDDPDTKKIIEDFRLSNYAITPEVRIYLSKKGYGQGFYVAPFYRHASFTSSDLNVFYTDDNNAEQSVKLSGKLTTNTGGILLGVQKTYGKRFVLDLWLVGPHFGSGTGDFNGITSKQLSQSEQEDLRSEMDDLDIPFTDKTVNVTANGASLKLDGPWGGLRSGILLGIRF